MLGQMMQQPLLISSMLRHAERHHGRQEIVSRRTEGDIHRYTYAEMASRARRMAKALRALGMERGDRVGTLAWNGYRHLELYYAASGTGAVLHTLNPRLHLDQLAWIIEHAQDKVLCVDLTFLPQVEALRGRLASVRHLVVMTDRAHMPSSSAGLLCYEDLIDAQDDAYDWPVFDENLASSLCYTSGTTGNPKGVLYSHRSTVLHAYGVALPDSINLSAGDCVLPVVPMFHVNAWGLPYSACMVGAKIVFPGPALDGKSLHDLFEAEQVTVSAGVPTVWQGLLNHVVAGGLRFGTMRRTIIGGSACPPAMLRSFEEDYGVSVIHGWGMTETSPFGTAAVLTGAQRRLPAEQRYAIQAKQGRCVFGIDLKVVDDDGAELPRDGASAGHLMVRGPWVLSRYYRQEGDGPLVDGWFPTGDIATIDPDGFMQITDRTKDVIKSGGEWISSIDLENIAMSHPEVSMAACIGVAHEKWDERPLLVVVRRPGSALGREHLLDHFAGRIATWWMPDDVVFVDEIPLGATGKMLKAPLRERYRQYLLDGRVAANG